MVDITPKMHTARDCNLNIIRKTDVTLYFCSERQIAALTSGTGCIQQFSDVSAMCTQLVKHVCAPPECFGEFPRLATRERSPLPLSEFIMIQGLLFTCARLLLAIR